MSQDKPHISPTQLRTFETCGIQYWFRYEQHRIAPPGIALLKGQGVHTGARENFRQKKDSHEDLPKKNIIEMSITAFENLVSESKEIITTPEETEMGIKKAIGQAKDSVVVLAELFVDRVAPQYQPLFVEEKYRIIVPKSKFDLMAKMDLADDLDNVMDLKTGTKSKTQKDVDDSEQLTFYALVFKALTKRMPKEVRLETLIEKKVPDVQRLTSFRDQQDLEVLVRRINQMTLAIEKKMFTMTSSTGWWCSERWCGYAIECPFFKNGDQIKKKEWLAKLLDEQTMEMKKCFGQYGNYKCENCNLEEQCLQESVSRELKRDEKENEKNDRS